MIHCLIVDDEPLARDVLRMHLKGIAGWQIIQDCRNAAEAFEAILSHRIDVIFLDIQMPGITGTDFLRSLREPPLVVFTTAHPAYAVEGFNLDAVDYLLKPITRERLIATLQRVEGRMHIANTPLNIHQPAEKPEEFIFVKQDQRQVRILLQEILFLEAKRDFTLLQLKDKKILASFNLKMLEGMLPEDRFMRVHRSYIVRLAAVESTYGNTLEMQGFQVPVSLTQKDAVWHALGLQ